MKPTFILAAALSVALCATANAGKYTCSFQKDGNEVKSCSIDPNTGCSHSYGNNLYAACATSDGDGLACAYGGSANVAVADMLRGGRSSVTTARARAAAAGMYALGITFAAPNSAVLIEAYREKDGASDQAVGCFPGAN